MWNRIQEYDKSSSCFLIKSLDTINAILTTFSFPVFHLKFYNVLGMTIIDFLLHLSSQTQMQQSL